MNVRHAERESIRAFMEKNRHHLGGVVLDFGSGSQPYRDLVSGEYIPFEQSSTTKDRVSFLLYLSERVGNRAVDSIMCNQVLQYVPDVAALIRTFASILKPGGVLLLTYPTSWTEIEHDDFWRFTKAGMEHLLTMAGFYVINHEQRASLVNDEDGFTLTLGYGCVAINN